MKYIHLATCIHTVFSDHALLAVKTAVLETVWLFVMQCFHRLYSPQCRSALPPGTLWRLGWVCRTLWPPLVSSPCLPRWALKQRERQCSLKAYVHYGSGFSNRLFYNLVLIVCFLQQRTQSPLSVSQGSLTLWAHGQDDHLAVSSAQEEVDQLALVLQEVDGRRQLHLQIPQIPWSKRGTHSTGQTSRREPEPHPETTNCRSEKFG